MGTERAQYLLHAGFTFSPITTRTVHIILCNSAPLIRKIAFEGVIPADVLLCGKGKWNQVLKVGRILGDAWVVENVRAVLKVMEDAVE